MRHIGIALSILPFILLSGCVSDPPKSSAGDYEANIRWTSHGIPHIRAADPGSAGYGLAYAVATDAICVLAEEFVTVRGERSLYFGDSGRNIDSDVFHRALLNADKLAEYLSVGYPESREMMLGYVAGYNRYIADHRDDLPKSCEHAAWVKPIDLEDTARIAIGVGIRYGLGRFLPAIANASPGKSDTAMLDISPPSAAEMGSNALAFGGTLTANGRGLLLGNPHYPWHGPSRFHMAHVTIPGQLDVMGVGLITTSTVAIGFNRDIAWTHTVSTALRFTLFRLDLVKGNPLKYVYGNKQRSITPELVTIPVKAADGSVANVQKTVYFSHLGPVVVTPDTPWSDEHVYVLRDVNYENYRSGDQYYDLDRATSVDEVKEALAKHQGASFVNTIAADRQGNALYADMSAIPYVDKKQIDRCHADPDRIGGWRVIVLNGSDPSCDWQVDRHAAAPGLMPPSRQPSLITRDYVGNSNDSYWLSNPDQPLEGFSPIIGDERTARSLRTRAGLVFVEEILNRGEKFTPPILENLLFSHRNYGAEILLDDILTICDGAEKTIELAAACGILAAWDRREDIDSVGAQIYNEFWQAVNDTIANHFAVPFDVQDPVHTPRGLAVNDPETREFVLRGLEMALKRLANAGVSPLSSWGDVQFAERNGDRIPIPGGDGRSGMFSVIYAQLNDKKKGYTPIITGNSYIQVVTWDADGNPDAHAILTYSQSPEPDSAYYDDMTKIYSRSEWVKLPFTDEQIAADLVRTVDISSADHSR